MLKRFFAKFPSFYFLNASQFLGALNDNIFKWLIVFFLIHLKGASQANTIVSMAGAVFVVPFLLFSSASGILADKISKRTVIVTMKFLEIIVMILGIIGIFLHTEVGLYVFLFLMGMQSAIFGPSKYGIIAELVDENRISGANASITSLTYLAIILGTVSASGLTDITSNNYLLVSLVCILISVLGFIASLGIEKTEAKRSTKKFNPIFFYEIYKSIQLSLKIPHLFPAILGAAFFLFIGAYVQLNVVPYAIDALQLSETQGGYLFFMTAVGIAVGAKIAGKLSKNRIHLGLACFSGFFIGIPFFLLSIFSSSIYMVLFNLFCLGVFGGMFLIPFETFIQVASPDRRRGQLIAASNFLSFTGVLVASLMLYLFNEKWDFTPAGSFAIIGVLTLIFNLIVTGRMAEFFLPFIVEKVWIHRYQLEVLTPLPPPPSFLIVRFSSFRDHLLLFYLFKNLKMVYLTPPLKIFPWLNGLISVIKLIPPYMTPKKSLERLFTQINRRRIREGYMLLYIPNHYSKELIQKTYQEVVKESPKRNLVYVQLKKEKKRRIFLSPLRKKRAQIYFH